MPLWLAAPVVWTGLELARAHVMTGFMMGSLAHTQCRLADRDSNQRPGRRIRRRLRDDPGRRVRSRATADFRLRRSRSHIAAGYILVALAAAHHATAALGYGDTNSATDPQSNPQSATQSVRIALIQGNSLADWKADPAKQQQIMSEYFELSKQAVAKATLHGQPADRSRRLAGDDVPQPAASRSSPAIKLPADVASTDRRNRRRRAARPGAISSTRLGVPVLVGIDRIDFLDATPDQQHDARAIQLYNSSVLVDRAGKILGTYDKFHLVMFGEYVPFSKWLPFLKRISSITGAAEAGDGPVALEIDGVCYAPSICYETVIPHVIRHQVATLDAAGERPDVLVNLTNDAWYWGSSELDMHLACDVFRAVETRTPLVIAANGGISAWIDRHGRIRAQSPRQQPDVILADVELNRTARRPSMSEPATGSPPSCLTCCVVLGDHRMAIAHANDPVRQILQYAVDRPLQSRS